MPAQSGNNLSISQIKDGLINPNFTTPLYVSETSFTVAGDVTSWLRPGRGVVISFATSGIKRCVVTSLSFSSSTNKTTINTVGDSLVNETITSVLLSLSDGENSVMVQNRFRPDPNLVLYLPLEEGSGTMTKDLSGWENHGTLVNGPTWSTGRAGKCLNFDGVDDYVNCGNDESLDITDAITIEAWIYPKNLVGEKTILRKEGQISFNIIPNDLCLWLHKSGSWTKVVSTGGFSSGDINKWYHIVATWDGNYPKLYVNGELKATGSQYIGPLDSSSYKDYIGVWTDESNWRYFFNGLIDEVRIYNRALTEAEIQNHYQNP